MEESLAMTITAWFLVSDFDFAIRLNYYNKFVMKRLSIDLRSLQFQHDQIGRLFDTELSFHEPGNYWRLTRIDSPSMYRRTRTSTTYIS